MKKVWWKEIVVYQIYSRSFMDSNGDGKDGSEPNNWESIFGDSAWEYDKKTEQYFLHLFSKKQPDLNWESGDMRREVYSMINWWLDKGIDGFRIDAISHIKKEEGLKNMDNPEGLKYVSSFEKHMNVDGIHEYLEELSENTFDKYDIMTVGEANGVKIEDAPLWVGEEEGKFNMIFQFEHLDLWNTNSKNRLDIVALKKILSKWQNGLENKGWNALYIENHDIPRIVSTWGNDKEYWNESSTALAVMYFMMQGTPFIYQGQEIGMTNVQFHNIEEYNDVRTRNIYSISREQGIPHRDIMKEIWQQSRDNSRTPMQWNDKINGGFSTGKPWLGVNPNYKEINVAVQEQDPSSILNFYKKMIAMRKENPILTYGEYNLVLEEHKQIFAYTRTREKEKLVVICNLTASEALYQYEELKLCYESLMLSNYKVEHHGRIFNFMLKPYEARVYRII